MIYLDIVIRPFPSTRKDKGYHIFVERMKEGSANTIEVNVLKCDSTKSIVNIVIRFIENYPKEYHYLKFMARRIDKSDLVKEIEKYLNDIKLRKKMFEKPVMSWYVRVCL